MTINPTFDRGSIDGARACDDAGFLAYLNSDAGQARFAKWMRALGPNIDRGSYLPDADTTAFLRASQRVAQWDLWPAGYWTEADSSFVIFDKKYRPLCRKRTNGSIEILPPATWINWIEQRHLYATARFPYPADNQKTRNRLAGVVERLGLADEIERRRKIGSRNLPRWSGVKGTA